jgi:non-heme chloroperoxidase
LLISIRGSEIFPGKATSMNSVSERRSAAAPAQAGAHREPFIETADGVRLFYNDWGTGKPVVFCHPWALTADIWEYQMIGLSEQGLRCVAYDRRGHGRSLDPGRGYDYPTLAADLATVIERLDLREITLVGYSMGSGEAIHYLSRYGADRVSRLVLVSPTAPIGTAGMFDGFVAGLRKDRPAFMTGGVSLFLGPQAAVSPAMIQWVTDQFLRASPMAVIQIMRTIEGGDLRTQLRALNVPTLIIHGDRDLVNQIDSTGRKMAGAISGCEFRVYEGAPHGLAVTHRDRLGEDLLKFVQS